jgi:outer membrane cobalamin receptor
MLRGPQGTLFGRNTIGGVIQPLEVDQRANGGVCASYGNYETSLVDGVFNFGIGDQWAAKHHLHSLARLSVASSCEVHWRVRRNPAPFR